MYKFSYKKIALRILLDLVLGGLLFVMPWISFVLLLLIVSVFFFPYFELIVFASVLDIFYGGSSHFIFTFLAGIYLIVIFFIRDKIIL